VHKLASRSDGAVAHQTAHGFIRDVTLALLTTRLLAAGIFKGADLVKQARTRNGVADYSCWMTPILCP
jgi:hypothetical protein